ncbi:MAG: hypothetical protein QOE03_851 [Micromonosporaceae bacterium]|nr:hypothetical protein [Micromonosporaceae bacterium]
MRVLRKLSAPAGTLAVLLAASLLGAVAAAAPASAKSSGTGSAPSTALSANHNCVVSLQRGANPAPVTTCFATFTQAVSHATNGAVTDARKTAAEAAKDPSFAEKLNAAGRAGGIHAAAASLVGIEYEALDFSTASWSFIYNGPVACTGPIDDIDYSVDLPSPVWDAISSFQTFFTPTFCLADHYFLQNFGLPSTGFFATSSPVPTMSVGGGPFVGDNNTRSITWS